MLFGWSLKSIASLTLRVPVRISINKHLLAGTNEQWEDLYAPITADLCDMNDAVQSVNLIIWRRLAVFKAVETSWSTSQVTTSWDKQYTLLLHLPQWITTTSFLTLLLTVSYMFRSTSVMAALVPDQAVIVLLVVPGKIHSLVIEWDAMESLD